MGCGASSEQQATSKPPPIMAPGVFKTSGPNPSAKTVSSKLPPQKSMIAVTCGNIYARAHPDNQLECLFLYPDARMKLQEAPVTTALSADVKNAPDPVNWVKGVRTQFKEFDSIDDIYKDWTESTNGPVPGLCLHENAGPLGGWASLNPHSYQQRYVLPDGRRMWSPMADAGHYHPSIPQRLFTLWKEYGEQWMRKLCHRIGGALNRIQEQLAGKHRMGAVAAERIGELVFNAEEVLTRLAPLFDSLEHMNTIHDLPPELSTLGSILSELEDNLVYNWFDVGIDVSLQIGTYQYVQHKKQMSYSKTLLDRALAVCVDGANSAADAVIKGVEGEIRETLTGLAGRWFQDPEKEEDDDDEEKDSIVKALFPDLSELIDATLACIDTEATGIVEELPNNEALGEEEAAVIATLAKWREEDAAPVEDRRRAFFLKHMRMLQREMKAFRDVDGDPDKLSEDDRRILDHVARIPLVMARHYYRVNFYLVFPRLDPDDPMDLRKPEKAELLIWPVGTTSTSSAAVTAQMTDLFLQDGGGDGVSNAAKTFAAALFQDSESSVSAADMDPRTGWKKYPNPRWRGFEVTLEVAMECTYNFHYNLDGVCFLDFDSFSIGGDGGECRRIRFHPAARAYTVNPLRHSGLVL